MQTTTQLNTSSKQEKALSISQLVEAIREPIKKTFAGQPFTIYGDVERVNPYQNHCYIKLVDKSGKNTVPITVFIKDTVLSTCQFQIEPLMSILITGYITLSTKNEIIITAIRFENLGFGLMQAQIDTWKNTHQNLFTRQKKISPLICKNIAVISNQEPEIQGLSDFTSHLKYGNVTVYQAIMQGKNVAEDIAQAIQQINLDKGYDCICIVRGGGSFADLFEYNKPQLLTAIAESNILVITAIGHETDHPLCDEVADIRYAAPAVAAANLTMKMELLLADIEQKYKEIKNHYKIISSRTEQQIKDKNIKNKHNNNLVFAGIIIVILLIYIFSK